MDKEELKKRQESVDSACKTKFAGLPEDEEKIMADLREAVDNLNKLGILYTLFTIVPDSNSEDKLTSLQYNNFGFIPQKVDSKEKESFAKSVVKYAFFTSVKDYMHFVTNNYSAMTFEELFGAFTTKAVGTLFLFKTKEEIAEAKENAVKYIKTGNLE